ncbi:MULTISPECIES: SH3 domain-containing protein [unclassified Labrenzia]|uniref:SH3 domain-containing protein n=1 Tax=unclassified Labrenzia TaxID=2648686 RepID=UPI001AD8F904
MGPDYWEVTGVPANDHLNVRSGPGGRNPIVATAPNGFRFRNLGCQGSGNSRWCHVETTNGQTSGWVAGRYLREPGTAVAVQQPEADIPELHVRHSGGIEVRYRSGFGPLHEWRPGHGRPGKKPVRQ